MKLCAQRDNGSPGTGVQDGASGVGNSVLAVHSVRRLELAALPPGPS